MSGLLGEGLLAPSGVRLFGRPYTGLTISDLGLNPTSNDPLVTQLRAASPGDYGLARIYGFTYLGNYFKLDSPIVMLVWGPGTPMESGYPTPDTSLDKLGVEFKGGDFTNAVRMWICDQADMSVRIDVSIGTITSLVLDAEMGSDNNVTGGSLTSRSDVVGRSDIVGRSDVVGRSDLVSRSDIVGRSDLIGPRRR